jgi:hypothetical protein
VSFLGGSFSYAYAYALDSNDGSGVKNNVGPVSYPGMISAGPFDEKGITFEAYAYSDAIQYATPKGQATQFTPWRWVTPLGPIVYEYAVAHASGQDPMTLSVSPGAQLTLSFMPAAGMGVTIPNASPAVFSSSFTAYADTDIPAFASLFSLSVNMSSLTPGQVNVNFSSNPLLGLNDAAITSELMSGFTYDSTTGDYSFDPTGQEIDATLTVPDGVSVVNITDGVDAEMDASVPEPSTLALVGIGVISLLACAKRRKEAKV